MGVRELWTKLRHTRWHQNVRVIAFVLLIDQALGTVTKIPPSDAVVVACIGALFAPIPVEKRDK